MAVCNVHARHAHVQYESKNTCIQADPDNNQNELSKHLRHDSSSSSESTCQSGGSMSSYDADPEFPFPKEVSGI